VACGLLLLLLVAASRFAAFPSSIWTRTRPTSGSRWPTSIRRQPPAPAVVPLWWRPATWPSRSRRSRRGPADPRRGRWRVDPVPLVALLSIWMRRELAAAAAALYLFLPGRGSCRPRLRRHHRHLPAAGGCRLVAAAGPGRTTVARGRSPRTVLAGAAQLVLAVLAWLRSAGGARAAAAGGRPLRCRCSQWWRPEAWPPCWLRRIGAAAPIAGGHARYQLAGLAVADHVSRRRASPAA